LEKLLRLNPKWREELEPDEAESVAWAADKYRSIFDGAQIHIEEWLAFHDPQTGIELLGGYPDGFGGGIVVDYKSGMMRDYKPQLAAEAMAYMQGVKVLESVRCIEVYGDSKQTREYDVSEDEAAEIVGPIIAARQDEHRQPRMCDYCGWCANASTCPAITTALKPVCSELPDLMQPDSISDPKQLGKIFVVIDACEVWLAAWKARQRDLARDGVAIPGRKITRSADVVYYERAGGDGKDGGGE
jgi:hypothetical protein